MNDGTIALICVGITITLYQIFNKVVRKRDIKWYDSVGIIFITAVLILYKSA